MRKILVVSDGMLAPTGLAKVARSICHEIKDEYKIASFAIRYPKVRLNIKMPDYVEDEYYCYEKALISQDMRHAIEKFDPDIVFTIHDFWHLYFISEQFYNREFSWVAYFPADVEPYPKYLPTKDGIIDLIDNAKNIDKIVAYNKFGRETLENAGIKVDKVIHHGVDTETFYPDGKSRERWRNKLNCKKDTFLFLSVGVNTFRKGYDNLLKSWKMFKEDNENALLYIHTSPYSYTGNGWNMPDLIKTIGVEDSVMIPDKHTILDDSDMNGIYNACDCFILTSMGEGFGLPLIEAGACKKPLIYTDYAGPSTVFKDHGIAIGYNAEIYYQQMNSKFVIIDNYKCAKAMHTVCNNNDIRIEYGEKAYKLAKEATWKILAEEWKKVFSEVGRKKKLTKVKTF